MKFLTADFNMMARWILSYGRGIEIEGPEELRSKVLALVEELQEHYLRFTIQDS
jgi:hypothetical protein